MLPRAGERSVKPLFRVRRRPASPGAPKEAPAAEKIYGLADQCRVFDAIEPFAGEVPTGFQVDFLGTLTDVNFLVLLASDPATTGGTYVRTSMPELSRDGEEWFEAVDWMVAAREASGTYLMMTLGANYAAQAVRASRALQLLNPMPFKLVAVEPSPRP